MSVQIVESDSLSRSLIFPTFFNERNVHADEKLWAFGKTMADGAAHLSAILRRLAPSIEEVHSIGCAIAAGQNSSPRADGSAKARRYYCGCRTASVAQLPLIGVDYTVLLSNVAEGGVDAHVDVALILTAGLTNNARAQTRTAAGLALAEAFGPAEAHVCDCDRGDAEHPFRRGVKLDADCDYPPLNQKGGDDEPPEIAIDWLTLMGPPENSAAP